MEKIIYVRDDLKNVKSGFVWINVHIINGYNQSLASYKEMLTEMQKTFPKASDENTKCHVITESITMKGFTLLTYGQPIKKPVEKTKYEGYFFANDINYHCS